MAARERGYVDRCLIVLCAKPRGHAGARKGTTYRIGIFNASEGFIAPPSDHQLAFIAKHMPDVIEAAAVLDDAAPPAPARAA